MKELSAACHTLTHFIPLVSLDTLRKHHQNSGFLCFQGRGYKETSGMK